MIKYLSGRVKRTPQDRLSEDRYKYLDLKQAEPNLADPATSAPVPSGAQYQLVAVPGYPGKRYWVPIGGGLIPGAISVFDEGTIVGTANSITQLNFVGAAVTANVSAQSPSGHPGIAATITVCPVTIADTPPIDPKHGELWWESDVGDLYIYYDDVDGSQWVTTNTGGRGDPGGKGDKGQKGEEGNDGLTGSPGVKGNKGDQNDKGQKGEVGNVEEKGNKGEKGDKGDKGQKGDKGVKGDKGDKGQKGEGDKAGLVYNFSSATVIADPGNGNFRYNNGSVASVSEISIDALNNDSVDVSNFIALFDGSNSTIKGHLIITSNSSTDTTFTAFEITDITDNTGWLKIDVQNGTGSIPSNLEECVLNFSRTGDKGQKGTKGDKGDKGDKGQKGEGVKGTKGDKGDKGDKGIKGLKGSGTQITIQDDAPATNVSNNGDLWWASDDFDLHVYYDDGDSSQWVSITSNTALKGEKGTKGDKGQKGDKGDKGLKGDSVKGQKGEIGPDNSTKGDKGDEGDKGDKGEGIKGQKGAPSDVKGQKGEPGDKGDKGEGQKGEPGQDGTDGTDGTDGVSIKGQKGAPGDDNSTKGQKGQPGTSIKGQKGASGSVTGTDHQVQYNNNGSLAGAARLHYHDSNHDLEFLNSGGTAYAKYRVNSSNQHEIWTNITSPNNGSAGVAQKFRSDGVWLPSKLFSYETPSNPEDHGSLGQVAMSGGSTTSWGWVDQNIVDSHCKVSTYGPGSHSHTCDLTYYGYFIIILTGAGGSGGEGSTSAGGGGGGSGGTVFQFGGHMMVGVTPTISMNIGSGGSATSSGNGNNGGNSTVTTNGGSSYNMYAYGGGGGLGNSANRNGGGHAGAASGSGGSHSVSVVADGAFGYVGVYQADVRGAGAPSFWGGPDGVNFNAKGAPGSGGTGSQNGSASQPGGDGICVILEF